MRFTRSALLLCMLGSVAACGSETLLDPGTGGAGAGTGGAGAGTGGAGAGTGGAGSGMMGDVGTACDPEAMTSTCASGRCEIGLESGGFCTASCTANDGCPMGYECRTDLNSEEADAKICQVACGDVTYQGTCSGAELVYCSPAGVDRINCASANGENGMPLGCAKVSEEYGYDCVPSNFTVGCGEVSQDGQCDGNTVVWCEGTEGGEVKRQDCAAGEECALVGGRAECRTPGTTGCGNDS
jgi:hypothetical protein